MDVKIQRNQKNFFPQKVLLIGERFIKRANGYDIKILNGHLQRFLLFTKFELSSYIILTLYHYASGFTNESYLLLINGWALIVPTGNELFYDF